MKTDKSGKEKEMNFSDGDFSNVKASNLYHVRVPEQFHKKKYSKLFDYLTTRRYMIPLGLYRTDKVQISCLRDDDDKKKKS